MEENKDNLLEEQILETTKKSGYFVDIEGETIEVDVKSDEEYSCLLNCLEGYYVYGGREEDDNEDINE